jgi:myo-inositol-1(or 4)-monophosphatase
MKDTLESALKTSGRVLLEYFNKPVKASQKESQSSIVTEADFASDSVISGIIRKKFPSHNLISEETGFLNNNSEYTWIIDPLDGTSNFASSIPWFGILISLFRKDEPFMGGAYLPVQDILYFAEKGKGAFRNDEPLTMPGNIESKNSLVAFSLDYTDDEAFLNKGIDIYKYIVRNTRNIRSTNSLIDFVYVAEGKFGGCVNLFTKVWDIAAPLLIIEEAGGEMIDIYGNDISFTISGKLMTKNFPVVTGSKEIVKSLRKILI